MAFVALSDLEYIVNRRAQQNIWGGLGQAPVVNRRVQQNIWGSLGQAPTPSCFLALPTNTAADEAQRRWLAMPEDQRAAVRAPYVAQIKASAAVVSDDQARLQAEQRAVNDILAQVTQERANPRLCTDVIRSLFYSTLGPQLAESLFTPEAVARIKQSALANGVPQDQVETLYAQAKASLGPLAQQTPQQAVSAAVDQITAGSGVSAAIPLSYTRERIIAIRDEAIRRGVTYDQVTRLVRDEVTRRIGIQDPNPYGDLEELAQRLGSPAQPLPQPTPPVYTPTPAELPVPVAAPATAQQPQTPSHVRRVRPTQMAARGREPGMPNWVVPTAAAAGGALLILLVMNASKR